MSTDALVSRIRRTRGDLDTMLAWVDQNVDERAFERMRQLQSATTELVNKLAERIARLDRNLHDVIGKDNLAAQIGAIEVASKELQSRVTHALAHSPALQQLNELSNQIDSVGDHARAAHAALNTIAADIGTSATVVRKAIAETGDALSVSVHDNVGALSEDVAEALAEIPDELEEALGELVEAAVERALESFDDTLVTAGERIENELQEIINDQVSELVPTSTISTQLAATLQPYMPQMMAIRHGLALLKRILHPVG
jgi:hypothetical protein